MTKAALRSECVRLRLEERLSLAEIAARTGAAKGSLSAWLREHPLTDGERAAKISAAPRYRAPKKDRGAVSALAARFSGVELPKEAKGRIAEAAVLARCALHGLSSFMPMSDGAREDWVVRVPDTGVFASIQVKWVSVHGHGLPSILLVKQTTGGRRVRYAAADFDFIVGYDFLTDTAYVFSHEETAANSSTVAIRPDAAERWDKVLAFQGRPAAAA